MTAILAPIEKTEYRFISRLSKYRNGRIKRLNEIMLPAMPRRPNIITGNEITHAKVMALIGISDHVSLPERAISQITQTIIPTIKVKE